MAWIYNLEIKPTADLEMFYINTYAIKRYIILNLEANNPIIKTGFYRNL